MLEMSTDNNVSIVCDDQLVYWLKTTATDALSIISKCIEHSENFHILSFDHAQISSE